MRLFITTVTLWALASAKPEMYKEKEDFQFSRSSSDDGSKSGYYGAQRGNMGGNYERAHNMDSLAQHQMSTLVRHVDGELGEGSNTRTGSVYTSGNSRGIYGSGNYDLSNLKGRNFGESGASYNDLYSSSSLSQSSRNHASLYSGMNNAKYSGNQLEVSEPSAGYQHGSLASQYIQDQDQQQAENQYHGSSSNYQYGGQGASQYKYYSHGSSQAQTELDQSANLQSNDNYNVNTKSRLISITPHRIYLRPGTRVTIPVAAQTYDASSLSQQEQSAVNTDAEVLNSDRQYVIKPVSAPKHYESSYSYHKEWEKHDTQPISSVPTENPFPKNSELYEDAQISGASGHQYQNKVDSTNVLASNLNSAQSSSLNSAQLSSLSSAQLKSLNSVHSNSLNSAHSTRLNSASSSGYSANENLAAASNRLRYLSQTQNAAGLALSSDVHEANTQNLRESNLYNHLNLVDSNSRPKSYQSSYSYHKSWERHGDPYIIKPATSDTSSQMSQKLVANSASYGTQSHNKHGSRYSQSQDDCVEPMRYKRSYNTHQFQQSQEEKDHQFELFKLGQQTDNKWESLENLGQQNQDKWNDYPKFNQNIQSQEQLSQHTQNSWGDLESFGQTQNQMGKLENLGQETQNSWSDLESFDQDKNQVGKLEELGQQSQNSWGDLESFGQQSSPKGQLENFGQQTQNSWGNFESFGQNLNQIGKLEDLGQQTQNSGGDLESFDQHQNKIVKLEDLGQERQNTRRHSKHKPQNPLEKLEDLSQETQNEIEKLDLGQETQSAWDHSEKLNQQILTQGGKLEDFGQQTQKKEDNFDQKSQSEKVDLGQQTPDMWDHTDTLSQQNQNQVGNLEDLGQETQNSWSLNNFQQQAQAQNEQLAKFGQETQKIWDHNDNLGHQYQSQIEELEDLGQQTQNSWGSENFNPQSHSQIEQLGNFGQETQNIWDHIDKYNHQDQSQKGTLENIGQQIQASWGSDSFQQQSQGNNEHIGDLGQETQKTWDNLDNLVPQTESKTYDQQNLNQQTQNGWNQVDINSPLVPQATRYTGKTTEDNIDRGHPSTSTEEHVNLWNNNYNFELQQHHDESSNIQKNFWHRQINNEQIYQQHSFNTWHHNLHPLNRDQSIPQKSDNNEILWDMVDKIIEESEKKEKNESIVHDNGHSKNSYSNQSKIFTTEKSMTETTQSHINNNQNNNKIDIENIGRGDIGPEDIQEMSQDNIEKSDENGELFNLPKESKVNNKIDKEHFHENPEVLNVISLENQKIVSTTTNRPKQPHQINHLSTQSFPMEYVPQSKPNNEYQDNNRPAQGLDNMEQQNLEKQYEFLEQTNINDKSLLDFSQQAQKPTNEDVEVLSQSNINQLEVQSHVSHEYQSAKKNVNLETKPDVDKFEHEQPLEVITEKPGFWKSVWSKTVDAKDTLVSWFKN